MKARDERLIEAGIALSVLVSAVHAVRPLVRRGEVYIGVGFGLLHGLAFAALLGQLNLSHSSLVTTLLGFNLGIELTQLLVVALVMPSLLLLSTTTIYPAFRRNVGALGAVLAAGWFVQRTGVIPVNPLEPVASVLVDNPLLVAAVLATFALGAAISQLKIRQTNQQATDISVKSVGASVGSTSQPALKGGTVTAKP